MFSQSALHNPRYLIPSGPSNSLGPLTSNRNAHITRLYSILIHLLSLPPSFQTSTRLLRAWRALAGCKEVHLGVLWRTGSAVIERIRGRGFEEGEEEERERNDRKADWLKFVQEGKVEKVEKFNEYILALVAAGRSKFALDELESYLDNQPYHDSISLNTLSAQLALLLAQPGPTTFLPPPPSSTTSSDEDNMDQDSTGKRRIDNGANGRDPEGRNGKRVKAVEHSSPDDELLPFLQSISRHSPALFSKAKERFKRAAQLEERQEKEKDSSAPVGVSGEAARWLELIHRSEKTDTRDGSPS